MNQAQRDTVRKVLALFHKHHRRDFEAMLDEVDLELEEDIVDATDDEGWSSAQEDVEADSGDNNTVIREVYETRYDCIGGRLVAA